MLTEVASFRPRLDGIVLGGLLAFFAFTLEHPPCAMGACPEAPAPVSLEGQLLIAPDDMADPYFAGTVIYMLAHDADGAIGVVINRPLTDVFMSVGGPVRPDQLLALHSDEWRHDSTVVLKDGLALTPDSAVVDAVDTAHAPKNVRFFLGYAGWSPGQLEHELLRGSWLVRPGRGSDVFQADGAALRAEALARSPADLR